MAFACLTWRHRFFSKRLALRTTAMLRPFIPCNAGPAAMPPVQYMVEQYFTTYKALPPQYWIGLSRPNASMPFAGLDGMPAFENVSDGSPYAHWAWWHPTHKLNTSYSCAMASKALQFEYYLGNSSLQHQVQEAFYQNWDFFGQMAYGWTAYLCSKAIP